MKEESVQYWPDAGKVLDICGRYQLELVEESSVLDGLM